MTRKLVTTLAAILCISVGASTEEAPRVRVAVVPEFPPLANYTRVTGDVTITVRVDSAGKPTSVSVSHGHPLLDESAVQAAKEWRFESAGVATLVFTYALVAENACTQKVLPRFRAPYGVEVTARRLTASCSDCETKPVVYERCE